MTMKRREVLRHLGIIGTLGPITTMHPVTGKLQRGLYCIACGEPMDEAKRSGPHLSILAEDVKLAMPNVMIITRRVCDFCDCGCAVFVCRGTV